MAVCPQSYSTLSDTICFPTHEQAKQKCQRLLTGGDSSDPTPSPLTMYDCTGVDFGPTIPAVGRIEYGGEAPPAGADTPSVVHFSLGDQGQVELYCHDEGGVPPGCNTVAAIKPFVCHGIGANGKATGCMYGR